jgi:hypothetical protein
MKTARRLLYPAITRWTAPQCLMDGILTHITVGSTGTARMVKDNTTRAMITFYLILDTSGVISLTVLIVMAVQSAIIAIVIVTIKYNIIFVIVLYTMTI